MILKVFLLFYFRNPTPRMHSTSWKDDMPEWLPYSLENKEFMLIQDQLRMSKDFTKRWNFNSAPQKVRTQFLKTLLSSYEDITHFF